MANGTDVISKSSGISIGLLALLLSVAIAGTWGAAIWAGRVDNRLASIERSFSEIRDVIKKLGDEHVDSDEFELWLYRLQTSNPTVDIPAFRR